MDSTLGQRGQPSTNYRLNGRFPYGVYFSTFDGEDYKFPIVDPVRLDRIEGRIASQLVPHAIPSQWLNVRIVPQQVTGYYSWTPTDDFILHMRPQSSFPDDKYAYVGRFSYEPESGEFLMGRLDTKHTQTIKQFGTHVFNKYVRGIYLKDQRLILIRAYFNPLDETGMFHDDIEFDPRLDEQKSDQTLEMLIRNNLPPNVSVIMRVDNETVKRFEPLHI